MIMRYNNYHCHSDESNKSTSDSIVKTRDYLKRAYELGHTTVFTTEHGSSRNIYKCFGEVKDFNKKIMNEEMDKIRERACKISNIEITSGLKNIFKRKTWREDMEEMHNHIKMDSFNRIYDKLLDEFKKQYKPIKMVYGAEAYYTDDINYRYAEDRTLLVGIVKKTLSELGYEFKEDILEILDAKSNNKKKKSIINKVLNIKTKQADAIFNAFNEYLNKLKKLDRKNYHIFLGALNINGVRTINKITSKASKDGFYYKPRVDMKMLLSLPEKDVIVTTACIGGRLFSNGYEDKFLKPLINKFGNNLFLEVQSHNHPVQIEHNKNILKLKEKYGLKLIHGNDSHYIYEDDYLDRLDFISGKGMDYGEENDFKLDYPDSQTIFKRYEEQGVLNTGQVKESLESTLIFDNAEELPLNDDVKMPTIYPELSIEQRFDLLCKKALDSFKEKFKNGEVEKSKIEEYKEGIRQELKIIKNTNTPEVRTADYFLLNEKVIKVGREKFGGELTRTSRGSGGSFYVNNLLGFTSLDRFDLDVPLYPTRFMSESRILESKSLPDIDFNTANVEPFIKAQKDVLGEDHAYYMIAEGTLGRSGAFRLMCRTVKFSGRYNHIMEKFNYDHNELDSGMNKIGKELGEIEKLDNDKFQKEYDKLLEDERYSEIIKLSERFVGVIDSVSPSPCSHLLLNDPISEEIGLIRIGDNICCNIDGYTADKWKFLKNDLLSVTVWDINQQVFQEIGKPIPSVKELKDNLLDDKCWKLYEDGVTKTLNQADSAFATPLVKKYKPKTYAELCAWVAAIRPSFESQREGFLNRIPYSTGVDKLDNLLKDSFHYLLYQENLMKFFSWLGIKEDGTYDLIKKIAKKKMTDDEIHKLELRLKKGWREQVGNLDQFEESWNIVKDSAKYLFNSAHSIAVAFDSLYGAYLKAHYPLEYYSTVLNIYTEKGNNDKISELTQELPYFNITQKNIEFGKSKYGYSYDKDSNSIFKGIGSIKYMNKEISDKLFEISQGKDYSSFLDLLADLENTKVNSRQLDILIHLNFFKKFGGSKKLLDMVDIFNLWNGKKQLAKKDCDKFMIDEVIMRKFAKKETEKLFKEFNPKEIIKYLCEKVDDKSISIKERLSYEKEYLGYIDLSHPKLDGVHYIDEYKKYSNGSCYMTLVNLGNGDKFKAKIKSKTAKEIPFEEDSLLYAKGNDIQLEPKKTKIIGENGKSKWVVKEGEFNTVLVNYKVK